MSSDFLDMYPEMFDLSDLSAPPPVSLDGDADPYASGHYDMASAYYGTHSGDYYGHYAPPMGNGLGQMPPEPPPVATGAAASSRSGSRGASVISEEGFIRL